MSTALSPLQGFGTTDAAYLKPFNGSSRKNLECSRKVMLLLNLCRLLQEHIGILLKQSGILIGRNVKSKGRGHCPVYTYPATALRVKTRLVLVEAFTSTTRLCGLLVILSFFNGPVAYVNSVETHWKTMNILEAFHGDVLSLFTSVSPK